MVDRLFNVLGMATAIFNLQPNNNIMIEAKFVKCGNVHGKRYSIEEVNLRSLYHARLEMWKSFFNGNTNAFGQQLKGGQDSYFADRAKEIEAEITRRGAPVKTTREERKKLGEVTFTRAF